MFQIMLFIFFCFFGILAMFFYIQWRQEQIARTLKEENTQLRVLLRALESRLDYLAQICLSENGNNREIAGNDPKTRGDLASTDPLLHLSFDEPGESPSSSRNSGLDINLP